MDATIRGYEPGDLGRVLQLWERTGASEREGRLTLDQAVDLIGSEQAVTMIAEIEGELVAVAIGSGTSAVGWLDRLTLLPSLPGSEAIVDRLLSDLEQRLAANGARRLGTLVGTNEELVGQLERWDYKPVEDLRYMEREIPSAPTVPSGLQEVFGQLVNPGLWDQLKGLEQAKQIIDRRVILPLEEPELASRHAVQSPKAIVLFGPPGTGKTTFAKGIASRLGWPFIELQPGELAGDGPEQQAGMLAAILDQIIELPAAVIFVDEVEDVASQRDGERRVNASVTNEFLRQIPRLREVSSHLLVCATNWVDRLDSAFLRPGRFDYVLPVGPPDVDAREAIWGRYVTEITDEEIDLERLVEATEFFTPADIEFAARKAAQSAFEREHFDGGGSRASNADFLAAIRVIRPTLSEELVERFDADRRRFSRY